MAAMDAFAVDFSRCSPSVPTAARGEASIPVLPHPATMVGVQRSDVNKYHYPATHGEVLAILVGEAHIELSIECPKPMLSNTVIENACRRALSNDINQGQICYCMSSYIA